MTRTVELGKYLYLDGKVDGGWLFIEDDAELEAWLKDGGLEDGDLIIEVKSVRKAVQKRHIELGEVKE